MGELTELERTVLDIESRHWRYAGTKEEAIRERTGIGVTAYYQRLVVLLDDPRAWEEDPVTMARVMAATLGISRGSSGLA